MDEFRLLLPNDQGIVGSLDSNGQLSFVVMAGPESPIRGTEMFDLMMRAFGERVRGIFGVWRRGFQNRPSVNLDKVNELTAQGVSLSEAVTKTWTVSRAARWNFTRVTIVGNPEGTPGKYTKIDVLIEKAQESP